MGGLSELGRFKSAVSLLRGVPPFVGRRQQLDWLEHCLQEAIGGRPRVALIAGEAGIGKTRLLKEIRAIALRCGVQVCFGRCYEDLDLPYLPFVEALRFTIEHLPAEVKRILNTEVEIIYQLFHRTEAANSAASPSIAFQTDQDKLRLFLALSRTIIMLARHCPLLFIVDNLHWADRSSLALFRHLVFAIVDTTVREPVPLLIIGSYRPVEPEEHLAGILDYLQREEICQTLALLGLSELEIKELIQALGLAYPSHQLVATISAVTQGNPLFIQEVLHHLIQQKALQERGGYVVTTSDPSDLRLPDQVTSAIVTRIQELNEHCRTVLTLASFLGDNFSLQMLGAVSGVNEDALLDLLEEGLYQRLLLSEGQIFQFAHALYRHVFYNIPSTARRQHIHQQIAQALEHLYTDNLDAHILEIAHHLIRAGPTAAGEKVVAYARRAGDQAFAVFAWGEAAHYYAATLSAAASSNSLSAHNRAELHYRAGLAHYRNMDVGPCLDHYEKAIEAYRLTDDVCGLAQVLMERTRVYFTQASVPYGTLADVQALENILKALGEREPQLRGNILTTIAETYRNAIQTDKAKETAQHALNIGHHLQDEQLCARASFALGLAQAQGLQVREALESWQNALNHARKAYDLWLQGWPLHRIPLALTLLGRLDDAEAAGLEACALTGQTSDWGDHSVALSHLASVAVAKGDFAAAERYAHETMMMVARSHYPWGGARSLFALACARALCGAWTEAEDALNLLVEPGRIFKEVGPAFEAFAWTLRRLVQAYAGIGAEVTEQEAADLMRVGGVNTYSLAPFCALVELSDFLAAPTLAESPYHMLSLAAERGVLFSSGWVFLIPRILGIASTLKQQWDKAEIHFQTAIAVATDSGARPELGRTYLDYARMLADREGKGDHCRTIELVRQAISIFNELGMEPFDRRAAQLAEVLQRGKGSPQDVFSPLDQPLVILVTDMEGSTDLIQRLGDETAHELLRTHDAIIRDCLHQYHGSEVAHTGDGIEASFSSASMAVECAVAIQQAFAKQNQAYPNTPIRVRIGLNAGKPILTEGRLFGAAVHTTFRICAHAQPGQILVSDVIPQFTAGRSFPFADHGRIALKGFSERFHLYEVRWESTEA